MPSFSSCIVARQKRDILLNWVWFLAASNGRQFFYAPIRRRT